VHAKAVLLMVLMLPVAARADRLGVAVRQGPHDATLVERLRGQLADLDEVALSIDDGGATEPTLEAQLAAAEHIASARDARVVVWFIARGRALEVAIATPADHRLFVREIPPAGESAMAEAAAIAVRGAVKSIALGGTIGVEVPAAAPVPPAPAIVADVPPAAPGFSIGASLGWQATLDGGADRGAQALVQRTTLARGSWAASLTLALGVPETWRASSDVVLDVARSGGTLAIERRFGAIAIGLGAGALIYHRSTSTAPSGLTATPSASTVAAAATAEVAWHARIARRIGLVAAIGVDVVAHAPEAVVSRDGMTEVVDTIQAVQPHASLAVEVGTW
jgi:hypothetical protein